MAHRGEKLYPLPNAGGNVFESTQLGSMNYDQGGFRLDHYFNDEQSALPALLHRRLLNEFDPLPIAGAGVPGFSGYRRHLTNSATTSWVHYFAANRADASAPLSSGMSS